MEFDLTEEQKQIKSLVKEFYQREVDPKRMADIVNKVAKVDTVEELRALQPLDLISKLHDVGLRQLAVPKKYGGTAPETGGNLTRTIAAEEGGYWGGLAGGNLLTMAWYFCTPIATNTYVTEEQKEWFFSEFMKNHSLQTGATVSEPSGMTDILLPYDEPGVAMKVTAHKDGNEWVINGDKMFSSDAGPADLFHVGTRTKKDGPPYDSWTFFWVKRDTPGVTMKINKLISAGVFGNVQTFYDNVRVPEIQMIGQPNYGGEPGYSVGESVFETKWIHVSMMLGGMQRIYEHMRDYAKERVVGGRPIIQHANIAALLGEAAIQIEALRALLYKTAWITDQRQENGGPINGLWNGAVWYFFKKTALRFIEIGLEVYGGIGGSVDMPLESFARFVLMVLPAGSTPTMEAIKVSMSYNQHPLASQPLASKSAYK